MTASVVDRLVDAINGHDLERLTECFAPTFSSVWPVHPARSFNGRDGVRRNWEAIFDAHPDIQVTLTTRAERQLCQLGPSRSQKHGPNRPYEVLARIKERGEHYEG
jgi:ketosteroid isomerase-like protein